MILTYNVESQNIRSIHNNDVEIKKVEKMSKEKEKFTIMTKYVIMTHNLNLFLVSKAMPWLVFHNTLDGIILNFYVTIMT